MVDPKFYNFGIKLKSVCSLYEKNIIFSETMIDAPPNSLIDSIASPKMKTTKGGVGVRSLTRSISEVQGHVGTPGWGLG
jgi:hypothetical protein